MMKLQGICAALATPFDYKGDLYKAKVQHNVEKWNKVALAGYAVATPVGEGPLLLAGEKAELWEMVAKWATPGRALIADVTAEGVRETVELAKRAAELGYHYALCGMPRVYPEAANLYTRAVADQAALPVILRDYAGEAGHAGEKHPNVAYRLVSGQAAAGELCGNAGDLWSSLKAGAAGAILGYASADPYPAIAVWEAFRTREEEAGVEWQARVVEWGSVPELKVAMDRNGYYGGPPRLPLTAVVQRPATDYPNAG